MTRADIIRMAQEAGAIPSGDPREWDVWLFQDPSMDRFAALVAAEKEQQMIRDGWRKCAVGQRTTQFCGLLDEAVKAERGACAKVCENNRFPDSYTAIRCAAAIRARGDEMNADGQVNTLQRRLEKRFTEIDQLRADAEIKRLQDMLYEQLGELTALRAEKQMRVRIEQLKEQPK